MMVAIHPSETSVLTRATWHKIPEEGILHSHHHETSNLTYLFIYFSFHLLIKRFINCFLIYLHKYLLFVNCLICYKYSHHFEEKASLEF
jgi:hypothetical protein